MITLGSLFSGIEGFGYAASLYGIKTVWASEIEEAPIRITKRHFPDMKHLGDITKINGAEVEPVDIITGGSPCFPAGTLVLTETGYKPIEDVRVGDMVLTHNGRWKKVTATGSKLSDTIILKGNHYGLECTPNHPIYTTDERKQYQRMENGKRGEITLLTDKLWVNAEDMVGRLWAVPNTVDELQIDLGDAVTNNNQKRMPPFSDDFFYFVGRWLGDGWVRDGQRPDRPIGQKHGTIFLCDSLDKESELCSIVSRISEKYSVCREKTAVKVKFSSIILCKWLTSNFGKYAIGKKMPGWVFGMRESYRLALLKGLIESDGHTISDGIYKITTCSKNLAESIRLLGETLNYSTTVRKTSVAKTKIIEGRLVNQHDYYVVQLSKITENRVRTHLHDDLHGWYRVRKIIKTNEIKTVYNISIEDDESYIADGIVVHNCQSLSTAGQKHGISVKCSNCGKIIQMLNVDDDTDCCPECGSELEFTRSGLFMEQIRIIREMRDSTDGEYPKIVVWENVSGSLQSNNGDDFYVVLNEFCKLIGERVPKIRPEKWLNSGEILGDRGSIAWRLMDAQYWGVPQRRKRIFLVADFRGQSASEILFKPESLRRHSAQSETPWERIAGETGNCTECGDTSRKHLYNNVSHRLK